MGGRPEVKDVSTNDIAEYYASTHFDYLFAWLNSENLAMHFGFHANSETTHSRALLAANEFLANTSEMSSQDKVLDAGCGIGGSSIWMATRRKALPTGIALGQDQIHLARQKAEKLGLGDKIHFQVGDFTCTGFQEKTFDIVWAQESLCHANDKGAFFSEAFRLLKPGGRLVIADFILRRKQLDPTEQKLLKEWLDGWKMPHLWTAAEHVNSALNVGFSTPTIEDVTHLTRPSHKRLYARTRRAEPFDAVFSALKLRNTVQHGNVVASLRQYETLVRDCWFYGVFSAKKL